MLQIAPVTLKEANAFVTKHHRHYKKPITNGYRFCLGVADDGRHREEVLWLNPLAGRRGLF